MNKRVNNRIPIQEAEQYSEEENEEDDEKSEATEYEDFIPDIYGFLLNHRLNLADYLGDRVEDVQGRYVDVTEGLIYSVEHNETLNSHIKGTNRRRGAFRASPRKSSNSDPTIDIKICQKCNETKNVNEFKRHGKGRSAMCKECDKKTPKSRPKTKELLENVTEIKNLNNVMLTAQATAIQGQQQASLVLQDLVEGNKSMDVAVKSMIEVVKSIENGVKSMNVVVKSVEASVKSLESERKLMEAERKQLTDQFNEMMQQFETIASVISSTINNKFENLSKQISESTIASRCATPRLTEFEKREAMESPAHQLSSSLTPSRKVTILTKEEIRGMSTAELEKKKSSNYSSRSIAKKKGNNELVQEKDKELLMINAELANRKE